MTDAISSEMALPEEPEVKGDAGKVLRWVNTLLISIGGFMAYDIHHNVEEGRAETKAAIVSLESKFSTLDKAMAVASAKDIYAPSDHIKFADQIHVEMNNHDKRITLIEQTLNSINLNLVTIKSGLGLNNGKE